MASLFDFVRYAYAEAIPEESGDGACQRSPRRRPHLATHKQPGRRINGDTTGETDGQFQQNRYGTG